MDINSEYVEFSSTIHDPYMRECHVPGVMTMITSHNLKYLLGKNVPLLIVSDQFRIYV